MRSQKLQKTVKNIKSVYVKRCNAKVENNKIVEYRAVVKVAFVVEEEDRIDINVVVLRKKEEE